MKKTYLLLSLVATGMQVLAHQSGQAEKPNILWIVSEDNCPYLGSYGDAFATTPNLDRLATRGFLYTHAYCNSPVCAPSRNAIITGVYAASNGNEHMRSNYRKSQVVRTYAEYLREAGYYCTNNSKTDYNTPDIDPGRIWDESSNKAHYQNRSGGKPFFAVFNLMTSHESSIHNSKPAAQLRHDPAKVTLPPYHPDTEEIRHDWAQYYDVMEDMDAQVGQLLKELEESGEAENTIVFYYGDNGGVLARSKRYIYESGTHVPLIIRIPEKYKDLYPANLPGARLGRMVSLVDLPPTLLSIAGIPVPGYMQGHAFLGKQKTLDPGYVFMTRGRMDERYDHSRAARDQRYRYIRNYMPFRIYGQHLDYLFQAPSARSWETAWQEGKCNAVQSVYWNTKPVEELYDTENDPWEVHNLAGDPSCQGILERMRKSLTHWMIEFKDAGLIPETEYDFYSGKQSMYDYMRSDSCPLGELVQASGWATLGGTEDISTGVDYLSHPNAGVRYWGATGLLIRKEKARGAIPALKKAGNDPSAAVAALYESRKTAMQGFARYNEYDALMSEWLLKKWGVMPK